MILNQLKLGPIDHFPFVGTFFPVGVSLTNEANEKLGKSVPFTLCLYSGESADQLSPVPNGIEIDKSAKLEVPCAGGISSTQVNIKILQPAGVSLFNARKFFLVAQPTLSKHFETVGYGYSDPLVAVNYRLVITNGHELPSIYYNATKGKGNKMELRIRLVDSQGRAVLDRPNLKLNFVLHYEDNTTVDQSEKKMLEIASDSKLFIGETGEAVIRFRIINAVSRKHGNRRFKVSVSADSVHNAARFNDVSFDYSPSIDVRTKVDEKARARRIAKKLGLQSDTGVTKPVIPDQESGEDEEHLSKKAKVDAAPQLLERPLSISFMNIPSFAPSFSSYTGGSFANSTYPSQPPSLAVSLWAEQIVEKIEKLRWKRVDDKDKSSSGSEDGEKFVLNNYQFCNPNAIIDEIVESSKNFIRNPSDDTEFVTGCGQVASLGPTVSRAHSLALPGTLVDPE
mmetsp:Transcript_24671/g.41711  ORF Transcript_24671/g.41711 Transcript_24671/m.41711 type:complete len:453 (-) Transcript_24671:444-1802(-)